MNKIQKYLQDIRERAKRRKSPWNFLLIPFSVLGISLIGFLLVKGILGIQNGLFPKEAILSSRTRIGGILMVSLFFPALSLGFMIANLMAWVISPMRKTFDNEAKGVSGTSFKESMRGLGIASIILLIVTLPVGIAGAMNYFYITPDGIHVNRLFSFKEKIYRWDQIKHIHIGCEAERDNLHLNYLVSMKDGLKVDLMEEPMLKFVDIYGQIGPFIKKQNGITYDYDIQQAGLIRLNKWYGADQTKKFLRTLLPEDRLSHNRVTGLK